MPTRARARNCGAGAILLPVSPLVLPRAWRRVWLRVWLRVRLPVLLAFLLLVCGRPGLARAQSTEPAPPQPPPDFWHKLGQSITGRKPLPVPPNADPAPAPGPKAPAPTPSAQPSLQPVPAPVASAPSQSGQRPPAAPPAAPQERAAARRNSEPTPARPAERTGAAPATESSTVQATLPAGAGPSTAPLPQVRLSARGALPAAEAAPVQTELSPGPAPAAAQLPALTPSATKPGPSPTEQAVEPLPLQTPPRPPDPTTPGANQPAASIAVEQRATPSEVHPTPQLTAIEPSAAAPAPNPAPASSTESLRIGAGDLLHVTVFREPDLEQKVRVKDSGEVSLPLIGTVQLKGLPATEAADAIARRYKNDGYLNFPQVTVFVEESAIQRAAVLGEVAHPGMVPITSSRSLLDVISEAGGLSPLADRHITIRHPGQTPTTVFLSNHAEKALADADILVQPGDTILVPKAGIVYVLGDVGRPGGFVMQDDARLSLLQALSMASGVNKTANEGKARLLRKVNGALTEQPLELKSIERGKQPDPQLEADDVIFIPFSMAKNVALGATSIVASTGSAAIYAVR